MYSFILREVCSQDEYFKDFEIKPFMFLPVNKFNCCPQLYSYTNSLYNAQNSFIDYKGNRHYPWYELLEDVRWHIKNNCFDYRRETVENNGINHIKFKSDD